MLRQNLRRLKNRVSGTVRRIHTQQFVARGDGVAPSVPHFVVYEPTLLCNLHCSFCYVADILNPEDWRSKELSLEELDRVFVRGRCRNNPRRFFRRKGSPPVILMDLMITDEKAVALADLAATGFLRHISVSIDGPRSFHDEVGGRREPSTRRPATFEG